MSSRHSKIVDLLAPPPPHASAEHAAEWRKIIASRPRAWWTADRLAGLAEYLEAGERCQFIGQELDQCMPTDSVLDMPQAQRRRYASLIDVYGALTEQLIAAHDRAFGAPDDDGRAA